MAKLECFTKDDANDDDVDDDAKQQPNKKPHIFWFPHTRIGLNAVALLFSIVLFSFSVAVSHFVVFTITEKEIKIFDK